MIEFRSSSIRIAGRSRKRCNFDEFLDRPRIPGSCRSLSSWDIFTHYLLYGENDIDYHNRVSAENFGTAGD